MKYSLTLSIAGLVLCCLSGCKNSKTPQDNKALASSTRSNATRHFVSSCESHAACVRFSFDYPDGWAMRPGSTFDLSDDPKFEKIQSSSSTSGRYLTGDFPDEPFDHVAVHGEGNLKTMEDAKKSADIEWFLLTTALKRISKGDVHMGSYDGYQITLSHPKAGTDRIIYVPHAGGGLTISIHDAPGAPEMNAVDDLKQMGRFSMILNSLKIGSE